LKVRGEKEKKRCLQNFGKAHAVPGECGKRITNGVCDESSLEKFIFFQILKSAPHLYHQYAEG
jgi:hypothetical protein